MMETRKEKKSSELTKALHETARDMHKGGLLDAAAYEKITKRLLGTQEAPSAAPVTSDDIRQMRERAKMSQAVFAHFLNVSVGYVSQLERGARRPSGPALALLNVIRRKGIEALM